MTVARRQRKHTATVQSPVSADALFERELEVFRIESETAAQFFYAYLAVHALAGAETSVYNLLNTAPLLWNTILSGLQTGAFVVLGRIFDQDSAHNLSRLLQLAQNNPQIFFKASLAVRKQGADKTPPEWLDSYLKHVYVLKPADFQRLRGYVSKHRKVYLEKYQPLRHRVFAHKGISDAADVSALFAKTNIREVQRMLVFLLSLYDAVGSKN
jgi:AbiU2